MWVLPFVFLLGLSVGSFLNVVVNRLSRKESIITGRSHCESCNTQIANKDLIPLVSFLVLRGKCRHCRAPIGREYPVIEFITGILFVVEYIRIKTGWFIPAELVAHQGLTFIRDLFFISVLMVIFIYDARHKLILDVVTFPSMVIALLFNLFIGIPWQSMLYGFLVVGGFFLFQFVVSRGRWIGGGDIRLGTLIGLMLGLPYGLLALFVAYTLGAFLAVILIATKKTSIDNEIAFGPFLVIGAYVALMVGQPILSYYVPTLLILFSP